MREYTKTPYTFKKRGIYYFTRRVPKDLLKHYLSEKISYSLRTKSARVAGSRALIASAKLDECWYQLRNRQTFVPAQHLMQQNVLNGFETGPENNNLRISVADAITIYLKLKGRGMSKTSLRAVERPMEYLVAACGKKPLNTYTKADAIAFRDSLLERGLTGSSIARVFGTVRSVFNLAMSEKGLEISNPFSGVYFDRQAGVVDRKPIQKGDIQKIQKACIDIDDDLRWFVALVSDTGMRLSEAAGLQVSDLVFDQGEIPFARIQEHPWRRLKTKDSNRDIPLVGASLWAAQRIREECKESLVAFPRYCQGNITNSNSASASLNKWLGGFVQKGCSMHSLLR